MSNEVGLHGIAKPEVAAQREAIEQLAGVSRSLARAAGMAMAMGGGRELIDLISEAGMTIDDVINDLDDGIGL